MLFCGTILQIFTNELDKSGLRKGVELLATARGQLAVDPEVAWRVVHKIRDQYGLTGAGGPQDTALYAVDDRT